MNSSEQFIEVMPEGSLEVLSQQEVDRLLRTDGNGQHELLRRCSLAVLNWGSETDSAREVFDKFKDFDIRIVRQDHGVTLELKNAPESAFVDGRMIRGIRELLFAVLRDIIFIDEESKPAAGPFNGAAVTNRVFEILRNARVLRSNYEPDLVVCWGGHSIRREEYEYCKDVGYQLGLRHLNVCTGCGPGAMKGPMKGAAIGHSKQRVKNGRYVGITEPGIIAAEPPNPIVNELVIMPDIEKRLEAFVRSAHAIVVFPGGVGTLEELLYLLGILLHPDNADIPVPLILTGPASSAEYFAQIDRFIALAIGPEARARYRIIVGNPEEVGRVVQAGIMQVQEHRKSIRDAFFFNWSLTIEQAFQQPFKPTHENMAALEISRDLPNHKLAANLRRVFSGLVAGNIRDDGIRSIEKFGPFRIKGEKLLMAELDTLLASFIAQGRMNLPNRTYSPCYSLQS